MLSINFRQPHLIDEASGLRQPGAIVAGFSVSNTALLGDAADRAADD